MLPIRGILVAARGYGVRPVSLVLAPGPVLGGLWSKDVRDVQPRGCPGCLVEMRFLQQFVMDCITFLGYSLQESSDHRVGLTKHSVCS